MESIKMIRLFGVHDAILQAEKKYPLVKLFLHFVGESWRLKMESKVKGCYLLSIFMKVTTIK